MLGCSGTGQSGSGHSFGAGMLLWCRLWQSLPWWCKVSGTHCPSHAGVGGRCSAEESVQGEMLLQIPKTGIVFWVISAVSRGVGMPYSPACSFSSAVGSCSQETSEDACPGQEMGLFVVALSSWFWGFIPIRLPGSYHSMFVRVFSLRPADTQLMQLRTSW